MASECAALVRELYDALERGDATAVEALLDPAFQGHLADGLPLGLGGPRVGASEMREHGWWAIGRAFAVKAEPLEWIESGDGRLVVVGRYVGKARSTGRRLEAAFTHVWSARDGRLTAVRQLTDTALWAQALDG